MSSFSTTGEPLPSVPWLTFNNNNNTETPPYTWQPNAGAIEKVSRSKETDAETLGRPYTCRPSDGAENDVESADENVEKVSRSKSHERNDGAENNGEKVTGSGRNNSENVSRLHNWPDRRDTLNDGVENVSRSKVNLQCHASAREKQRDRKDIGTGQTEVTDNDSQDSDSNYQTSIDDSDVENTRTRDKRTAT